MIYKFRILRLAFSYLHYSIINNIDSFSFILYNALVDCSIHHTILYIDDKSSFHYFHLDKSIFFFLAAASC